MASPRACQDLVATSYNIANDILTLFNVNRMVDTLHLTANTGITGLAQQDFGVSQVGGSVVIHADGPSYGQGGNLLPIHG